MTNLKERILAVISRKSYQPLKAKALARKVGVPATQYDHFRRALKALQRDGRIEMAKNRTIRTPPPHGTIVGTYRRTTSGLGFVRPHRIEGQAVTEVRIREDNALDASTGDVVLVKITRKPSRAQMLPTGEVLRVVERSTRHFVGTYFEREGESYVRVDGTVFSHSVWVGDPGAHDVRPGNKVVFEMVCFPTPEERGEGVITEVLGAHAEPGVDTLSIIRAYQLPDAFPEDVLQEARAVADAFNESDLENREDFTRDLVVTIDPVDARDFDDAISVTRDEASGHWQLTVHIADVGHFVPPGGALDSEARNRGTSVYLPQRVLPMFPEIISNHLASLQQGRVRYVMSVIVDFTPEGQKTSVRFARGAIRVRQRFTYEQVLAILEEKEDALHPAESVATRQAQSEKRAQGAGEGNRRSALDVEPDVHALLLRAHELASILRQRRTARGALELNMPEVELEYDEQGRVSGGHFRKHDISHQLIEEFMLTANEAVAEHFNELGVAFLRRVHPDPDPHRLSSFAGFVRSLDYDMPTDADRFALQRILNESAERPEVYAVHYALLRSLKQAVYSPEEEGHYALASENYCHFTSPIRRYPDLVVHRQLERWLRTGKARSDETELIALGEHCSKTERRAEKAERELVKLKLLTYMSERVGQELDAIVSGVADYGFYAQAQDFPVEGLVHISTLPDDYYDYEDSEHSLIGRRSNRRYRLGDKVRVQVVHVDMQRRQLDLRVVHKEKEPSRKESSRKDKPTREKSPRKKPTRTRSRKEKKPKKR